MRWWERMLLVLALSAIMFLALAFFLVFMPVR
jgi:hypothetical protein